MSLNVGRMVSQLRRVTVKELQRGYAELCGEPTQSNHKDRLFRRIAWRMLTRKLDEIASCRKRPEVLGVPSLHTLWSC